MDFLMNLKLLVSGLALMFASAAAFAEPVRLIHAINGANLGLTKYLPVDVRIGYRCVAKAVPFTTIAPSFNLKPGIHVVRISLANAKRPCRGQRVLTEFVPVNFGDNLSLVAHQNDDGGIALTRFVDDVRSPGEMNGRVTVRHTADAPVVDIVANGGVLIGGLANGESAKADVRADTYMVSINPAGSGTPVFRPAPLPVLEDNNRVVYAVGSLSGEFELIIDDIATN